MVKRLNRTIGKCMPLLAAVATALILGSCASEEKGAEAFLLKYNNDSLVARLGVGLWGTGIPADRNNDGLTDLVVTSCGRPYRGTYLYYNIGTNDKPLFDKAVKISDTAYQCTHISTVGGKDYVFAKDSYYPDFTNGSYANPQIIKYEGEEIGKGVKKNRTTVCSFIDWDEDGDLDVVYGTDSWDDYGWDNAYDEQGNWKNGPLIGEVYYLENEDSIYYNRGRLKAGGEDITTYGAPYPSPADYDNDGDQDLVCGEFVDGFTYYENVGNVTNPVFAAGRRLANSEGEIKMYVEMITPQPYDFDKDGRTDLVVGDEDGSIAYLRNTGVVIDGMPQFDSPLYLSQVADNIKFGSLSTPCAVDWDDDGKEDLVVGNSAGELGFIRNLTGGENPVWDGIKLFTTRGKEIRVMAGMNGSIQGPAERKWGYTVPIVADWDGDGKKDIIINSIFGEIMVYYKSDDSSVTSLEEPVPVGVAWNGDTPKPAWNWKQPEQGTLVTQWRTTPYATDWNKDGLTDMICLDTEGYLAYYERYKTDDGQMVLKKGKRIFYCDNASAFTQKSEIVDNVAGVLRLNAKSAGASGRRKFCFTDYDKDGDEDLIVNSKSVAWFENTAVDADGTVHFMYRGDLSDLVLAGHTTCPTPVDWDKDGYPDILAGCEDGFFFLFKNTIKNK